MKRPALLIVVIASIIALPTIAETPQRVRVVGAIAKLEGDRLAVSVAGGQTQAVTLTPDATIYGVEKRRLGDLKPGDFVASGGVRGTGGKIHAVEVRIFPEALRGTGEGQRPWDVKPRGVMTNAIVGTMSQTTDGGVVHVTYKRGESEYLVGPDVPVLAYVAAGRALLKLGAAVVMIATKQADGSLQPIG